MNDAMSINVDGSPGLMGRVGQKLCAAKERANKAVCLLDARMRLLTAQVDKLLTEARHLGFDRDTVMELIEKRHKQRGRDDE